MSHKLTDEEKETQRRADLERLRQQTLENNKSFDPRLIRRPTVQLYSPTVPPDLVTPATKKPEESSAAVQPTVQADQAIEYALVPESPVEKPSELVRSEEPPPRAGGKNQTSVADRGVNGGKDVETQESG